MEQLLHVSTELDKDLTTPGSIDIMDEFEGFLFFMGDLDYVGNYSSKNKTYALDYDYDSIMFSDDLEGRHAHEYDKISHLVEELAQKHQINIEVAKLFFLQEHPYFQKNLLGELLTQENINSIVNSSLLAFAKASVILGYQGTSLPDGQYLIQMSGREHELEYCGLDSDLFRDFGI